MHYINIYLYFCFLFLFYIYFSSDFLYKDENYVLQVLRRQMLAPHLFENPVYAPGIYLVSAQSKPFHSICPHLVSVQYTFGPNFVKLIQVLFYLKVKFVSTRAIPPPHSPVSSPFILSSETTLGKTLCVI